MRPVSTAAQIREQDRRVIEDLGLPGLALMELAADGVVRALWNRFPAEVAAGVTVMCGPGNNGGDGYAIGRRLHARGVRVHLVPHGEPRAGSDAARMAALARGCGIPEGLPPRTGLWVDALFGTGLTRALSPATIALLAGAVGAPIVAVDLPSGLCSDTGRVLGACPTAALTVTFAREKLGMFLGEGPDRCGVVEVVDLGLGACTPPTDLVAAEIPERADLVGRWPSRARGDHKTRSGHLLVVAGSAAMAGAAVLCCRGALAAGAGLVTLAAPDGARARLGSLPPEVMVWSTGTGDRTERVPDPARFSALVAGPGLGGGAGVHPGVKAALAQWWRALPLPVAYDADALDDTSEDPRVAPRLLLPHPGEAARLLGCTPAEVEADRLAAARRLSARGVVVLKGPWSIVAASDVVPSLNPTGNPVLASGGTGDVLTGLAGALLARGLDARDAARLAAWVHGAAADRLAARRSQGWTAADVAAEVPEVVEGLLT